MANRKRRLARHYSSKEENEKAPPNGGMFKEGVEAVAVKKIINGFIYAVYLSAFSVNFSRASNKTKKNCYCVVLERVAYACVHTLGCVGVVTITVKEWVTIKRTMELNPSMDSLLMCFNMILPRQIGSFSYFYLLFRHRRIGRFLDQLVSSIERRLRNDKEIKNIISRVKVWSRVGAILHYNLLITIIIATFTFTLETNCDVLSYLPHFTLSCDWPAVIIINTDAFFTYYRFLLLNYVTLLFCFCVYLLHVRIDMCARGWWWKGKSPREWVWYFQDQHQELCRLFDELNRCFSTLLFVYIMAETIDIVILVRIVGYRNDELKVMGLWCYFALISMIILLFSQVLISAACNSKINKAIPKMQYLLKREKSLQSVFHSNFTSAMTMNFHTYATLSMLNPSSIAALGYFELNKTLLASIAGTILTYSLMLYGIN